MPLTRRSKIKDVWRHPVGHELLLTLMRQLGKNERWVEGPLMANRQLHSLDRMAGAGFSDMVVEMASYEPDNTVHITDEELCWWKEAVFYHIYLPSFMDSDHDGLGDLGGVTQRLPYLEQLGVTALWLWPLVPQAGGNSQGVMDFYSVEEDLGGTAEFERLIVQAHSRGMQVVMGVDLSATSDEHPWFLRALAGEKAGYYYFRPGAGDGTVPPNNWTRPSGGSAWTWYPQAEAWGLHLAGRHKMDLNWDNAAVRTELAGVLDFWIKKGVDGFYLGPVAGLSKGGFEDGGFAMAAATGVYGYEKYAYGPRLHRYLRELRTSAPAPVMLMGEVRGVGTEMAKLFTSGERGELDMLLDTSPLMPKAKPRSEDAHLDLADLRSYYLQWMGKYGAGQWMSLVMESPNMPRVLGRLGANPLYRAILAKLLGTLLLTLRGTPILYQGAELGLGNTRFTSADELRDAASLRRYAEARELLGDAGALQKVLPYVADHARVPMPWGPGPKAGFTGAEPWMRLGDGTDYLNANAQMEDEHSVWRHYQRLIEKRKASPALSYGSFNPVFVKNKRIFCYFRIYEGEKWYVEMNLTERQVPRPGRISRSQRLELSNYDAPSRTLRPYEANLYFCE